MTSALEFLQMFKRGKRYYNLTKTQKKELESIISDIENDSEVIEKLNNILTEIKAKKELKD